MRYTKEHKAKTRAHILRVAARLFRRHGYDGVSIDTLMDACGLTRGGFYGHFRSKSALYDAVLDGDHDFVVRLRARTATSRTQLAEQGRQVARDYLDPAHRDRVVRGCALASLAMETARARRSSQRSYAKVVRQLAQEFGRGMEGEPALDDHALAAVATCVGGLLISAACAADDELSTAMSRAASDAVAAMLARGRPRENP